MDNPVIAIVSHVLGGFDGVSVQADRLAVELQKLGASEVRLVAGAAQRPDVVEVPGLCSGDASGVATVLRLALAGVDVVVADNIATLPTSSDPAGQRRCCEVLAELAGAGTTVVVRHHDPSWDCEDRAVAEGFPALVHPAARHVAVSRHVADRVAAHLDTPVAAWPNTIDAELFDLAGPAAGLMRDRVRREVGLEADDIAVLHPVRGWVARKNMPAAVDIAVELERRTAGRARYWLTGVERSDPTAEPFVRLGPRTLWGVRRPRTVELFAAADIVVLPSHWEGWGLAVPEACAAGRPVVWGDYPAAWELAEAGASGVHWRDPDPAGTVLVLLGDAAMAARNAEAARALHPDRLRAAVADTLADVLPCSGAR